MMKLQKFSPTALALAVAVSCASGAAIANPIDPYLQNGQNLIEDDSNEYLFRSAGAGNAGTTGTGYDLVTTGNVQNDDLLIQILDFSIINGTNIDSDGIELTGIAVNKVQNISAPFSFDPDGGGPLAAYTAVNFDQVGASAAEWTALTGIDIDALGTTYSFDDSNLVALLYGDTQNNLDVFTQGLPTTLGTATDGQLTFALGIDPAATPSDFIAVANVPQDVSVFAPDAAPTDEVPGVTIYGGFSYGMSILYEDIDGITYPSPLTGRDFAGSGNNLVTDRLSIAAIIDDTQGTFYAEVPEPATLALLGAGLLGLGFGRRRAGAAKA